LFWLASLLIGVVILIFGEIIPKLYARQHQNPILRRTAIPVYVVARALQPGIAGITRWSDFLKRLISRRAPEPLITTDELRQVLADTHAEGLAPSARRMLSNLMSFDQVKVREVMIPRAHMAAVPMDHDSNRMFAAIIRSGFSRLPVYFGNVDNILGIVYAKDLLAEWRSSGLLVLEDLLRPPFRIAPDAPLPVLLQAFRQGHHLAVVTDSLGHTQGVVTIEDAVEAIVGDIADEFDQPG
ncbi:MAG TPA: CNNM domain-containing protein, partial [Elusimicrobiota bacterium]|nr:CNNM domain-containing protein [Elusimicrobiota bacterium]